MYCIDINTYMILYSVIDEMFNLVDFSQVMFKTNAMIFKMELFIKTEVSVINGIHLSIN